MLAGGGRGAAIVLRAWLRSESPVLLMSIVGSLPLVAATQLMLPHDEFQVAPSPSIDCSGRVSDVGAIGSG